MKLRSYPTENEAINKDAPNKMEKKKIVKHLIWQQINIFSMSAF